MYYTLHKLIWRDIRAICNDTKNIIINAFLLPLTVVVLNGFFLPAVGIEQPFVHIFLIGSLFMMTQNTQLGIASDLLYDLTIGKRVLKDIIVPPSLLYFKYVAVCAIKSMIANILLIPMTLVLLSNDCQTTGLSAPKLFLFFVIMTCFVASICIFSATLFKSTERFWQVWPRWGLQIFVLGGTRASWLMIHKAFPIGSYFDLLNPYLYIFEGLRGAIFGPQGALNFWVCCLVLTTLTITFFFLGTRSFKKRLAQLQRDTWTAK